MWYKKVIIFLGLISSFTGGAYAQQKNNQAQLDSLFIKAHRLGLFNGNVLVETQGKILYNRSYGMTDAVGKTSLTSNYRFNIGSIAKEFNAVAIMMLKERGKLNLDDKLSKFFPELPEWATKIKIMNLLQYTSGIPDSKWREIKGDADNMAKVKLISQLDFEPGTKYAYNNNNTFFQRQVVEKVSGMSFNEFVYTQMLRPVGIKNAIIDPSEKDALIAMSYNNQKVQDDITPPISGWTTLNVQDFLTWSNALNNFKLISPASTNTLTIPFSPGNQTGLGRGLIENNKLVNHVHDGSARNYQALLVSETGTTIILQTNNQQNNLYPISRAIQAILQNKPFAYIKKSLLTANSTAIAAMNGKELMAFYEKTKTEAPDDYAFDSEDLLNEIGYNFLRAKKTEDAIMIFEYNTRLFPQSGNVFDSLAEAYYNTGDKVKALSIYEKALKLNPNLDSAKRMIAELKSGGN